MAGLTLDAGPLIAADRGDRRFWAYWKEAERRDADVTVPTTVVAQVWRGARNARMAALLAACAVEVLDQPSAQGVGLLCARSATSDVVDASVIISAASRNDDILTTDPADLAHLASEAQGLGRILDLRRLPSG